MGGSVRSDKRPRNDFRPPMPPKKAKYSGSRHPVIEQPSRSGHLAKPLSLLPTASRTTSLDTTGGSGRESSYPGHLIRDCPANMAKTAKAPAATSPTTQYSHGRGPRQVASGVSSRTRGSASASNRPPSKAPVQVYHVRSREEDEDPDVIAALL
ncbi:hypothetical protein V6N13_033241 [Hibiscus sabdariffa]